MTEAQIVRLANKIDWTCWDETQQVQERVGKGATSVLRDIARRLGLDAQISRAGIDVIFVRLHWNGDS